MVHEMMDMLGRDEAEPEHEPLLDTDGGATRRKIELIEEIAENGEAIITFKNSHTTEVHGDDTYFYPEHGVFFTEDETPDGEEAETWYFAEDVLSLQRH